MILASGRSSNSSNDKYVTEGGFDLVVGGLFIVMAIIPVSSIIIMLSK